MKTDLDSLAVEAKAGDLSARERLMIEMESRCSFLAKACYSGNKKHFSLAELHQEARIACWQALPIWNPTKARFATWAETQIRYKLKTICRAERRRPPQRPDIDLDAMPWPSRREPPADAPHIPLDVLTPSQRRIVELRFGMNDGQELSIREVAQRAGISSPAATRLLSRALQRLGQVTTAKTNLGGTIVAEHLMREGLLSLAEAAKRIPGKEGRQVSVDTVRNWVRDGCHLPGGGRLRLEAIRLGQRWYVTRGALARFADRLTAAVA